MGSGTADRQFAEALGYEVRAELEARDMTQTRLAKAIGLERATLSRYLHGHRDMPMSTFRSLAEQLGVQGSELMSRAEASAGRPASSPMI